jgi:anti-sigma factor RsiW
MSIDITCAECAECLPEYVAGLSGTSERERIERHVRTCDLCHAELAMWRAIGEAVEQDVARIPPDTRAPAGWAGLVTQLPARHTQPYAPSTAPASGDQQVRRDRLQTIELDDDSARHPGQSLQPLPANRSARRWMAPIGVVAALLIVALGATLFAALASRRSTPGHGGVGPGQANAQPGPPLPDGVTMTYVTLAAPGAYWATGFVTDKVTGRQDTGVILRFTDGKWTQVGDALPFGHLDGLDMVSATEGWAWGGDRSGDAVFLRISGGAWRRITVAGVNPQATPQFIRMSSANDGWLAMQNPKTANGDTTPSSLFHYSDGVWNPVQSSLYAFWDLAAVGPGEAWMVGGDAVENVTIVHVKSGQMVIALRLPNSDNTGLDHLRAFAPNNVWATGVRYAPAQGTVPKNPEKWTPALYHYDGASWEPVAPSDMRTPAGVQQIQIIPYGDMWATRSVTVSVFPGRHEPTENRVQALYQLDRGVWSEVPLPYSDLVGLMILSDASTTSDIWAVGSYSVWTTTLDGSTVSGGTYPVLLHYLNGAWTDYGR